MSDESICLLCEKVIEGSVLTVETGETFHPECFFCDKCNGPLTSPFLKDEDGKKLCNKCKTVVKCTACGEVLEGAWTTVGDKNYHPSCLVCVECKEPLGETFVPVGDQFSCVPCMEKKGVKIAAGPPPDDAASAAGTGDAPAPVKDEPAPVKDEPAPVKDEPAPAKDEVAPAKDEPAPAKDEPAPAKDESASVKDEPAPPEPEPAPAKPEAAPAKPEPAPAKPEAPPESSHASPEDLSEFTLAELQNPEVWHAKNIDPAHRERYLAHSEFKTLFGVDKEAFKSLPKWKQDKLKKEHKLF